MKNTILFLSLFLWISVQVNAQPAFLSITNNNQALVEETRKITVNKGLNPVQVKDLPALLDPASVTVNFGGDNISLLEQTFLYDLNDTEKILAASVGRSIRLVHPETGTVQGTLLSVSGGILVLETFDKEIRMIPSYQSGQIVIEKPEAGDSYLTLTPTLSWLLQANSNLNNTTTISYLTDGLNWNAEYAAILTADESELALSARVMITNTSGKSYNNCHLQLIAGELNRPKSPDSRLRKTGYGEGAVIAMSKETPFEPEKAFEYYIYDMDRPANLENNQTKSLLFFPGQKTPVDKLYNYNYSKDAEGISVLIKIENSKRAGLGNPLPSGRVRIYKKQKDHLMLLGEDLIDHIPAGEEISLEVGKAFDLLAERTITDRQRDSKNSERLKIAIELRNRKNEDVRILVTEPVSPYRTYRVISSNFEIHRQDSRKVEFYVPVAAGKSETLTFEMIYNW